MSSMFLLSEEGASAEEGDDGHHDHEEVNDFGIGTVVLAMALGTVSRMYITHITGLPYTVVVLLIGLLFGVVLQQEVFGDLSLLGDSLMKWTNVSPEVILFVFLPILIFESAFNTDVHIFQREFWQVLTLAGPGVVIATALTACVVKYAFPYNWGWNVSLMLGGMLSATDPVAVVALLKELGVSERLAVLIEGESLLNDAAAIVVFIVFRDAFVGFRESSPLKVLETASRMSLGGPVVGVVLGMLGSFSLGYIIDDAMTEITLTVIVCFSAFMISEATELEVSGVLAVVTTGLVMSFYARGRISPGVEESMHTFWSMATYVANTVIFFVSGLIIGDRALFDHHIEGREWGLLGLLYLALQAIRFIVVLILLPVLTKGGYGMTYKQIAVLAFAGLRGAVVLTLGLIVVEDERINEDTRSLVLFYVAGIAAMTLVINGSLAGPLVHYLGLDRSTTAETEVFTRACAAIEARLEHKLDLLKGDRFLGDADWEVVWRYIPVSTAKSYWHRIRHGNINLSVVEEEDIHAIRNGRLKDKGARGELEHRARQVKKWFTRRVLRLPGGVRYDELPSRLRVTWYTYHKKYHLPTLGSSEANAEQHRRDMELHRLNAEPRMMLEAEAWSNLNVGGGADLDSSTLTPASSTLRKHLDNVGVVGLKDSVGMMSGAGQAQMELQASGAAHGSTLWKGNGVLGSQGAAKGEQAGAGGGYISAAAYVAGDSSREGGVVVKEGGGAGGGGDLLWKVEGVEKLKEDRRRAAQAVAKAEARLARLKKDMGLILHKGEEEEMAEFIMQAKKKGPLSSYSMHGRPSNVTGKPSGVGGVGATARGGRGGGRGRGGARGMSGSGSNSNNNSSNDIRGSIPHSASDAALYRRGQSLDFGLSTTATSAFLASGTGPAASIAGKPKNSLGSKDSMVDGVDRVSRAVEEQKGEGDGDEEGKVLVGGVGSPSYDVEDVGLPMDEDVVPAFRSQGKALMGTGGTWGGGKGTPSQQSGGGGVSSSQKTREGEGRGRGDRGGGGGEGGDGHAVPSEAAVEPEWDPYEEDSDGEDGTGRGGSGKPSRPAMGRPSRRRQGGGATGDDDGVIGAGGGLGLQGGTGTAGGGLGLGKGRGAGIGPGAVTMGSMSEARVRFLTAVKAHFTERYRQGWLSSMGLRVLKENMDAQLDYEEKELEQWSQLQHAFTLPASMAVLRKVPLLGSLVESYMYRRLTFIFELASNFISAHEDVDILELLNEGPVAYQLAYEKNRQLQQARATLAQQLPVFPELARSLKTRVAARYMLVQHRDVVHELFHHGHINEREFEGLVGQNNTARVKLDYHPTADQIPDRVTLLKNVPFLRFLSDEEKEAIINDEKACQEEFYGSNVVLMQEKTSVARGHRRAGWFNVVRGAVRQNTEGLLDHTSLGGTVRTRRLAKERLVNAGTVIGLDEQLMQAPYKCTYVTASFVHLFFFDKTQMLVLAEQYPGLKRGLWWLLAVSVVRHHRGFRRMNLMGVYQLMRTAEFRELKSSQAVLSQESRHAAKRGLKIAPSPASISLNSSRHKPAPASSSSARPAIIRAAASLNESRHKLSGLLRTVSRNQLPKGEVEPAEVSPGVIDAPKHRVFLEEGSNVLLLRGVQYARTKTTLFDGLTSEKAVTIIRDISGPVDFSEGSVIFIMPTVLLARSSSSHQLLMRAIEERPHTISAAAAVAAGAARLGDDDLPGSLHLQTDWSSSTAGPLSSSRWKNPPLSASGTLITATSAGLGAPPSPSRARSLVPMSGVGMLSHVGEVTLRNAVATDAATIAAADEANPMLHPDTLRRKRTLRDAGLAAKAAFSSTTPSNAAATGNSGGVSGSGRSSALSQSAPRPRLMSGEDAGDASERGPAPNTAKMALRTSRNNGDSFVEMMAVPVANMDEDSPRSRAHSALLFPDGHNIDPSVHTAQVAHRLEEDRSMAARAGRSGGGQGEQVADDDQDDMFGVTLDDADD